MLRSSVPSCAGWVLAGALSGVALADPIPIANHSFELPVVSNDSFITTSAPTGWTAVGTVDFGWRAVGVVNPNTTTLYLDPVPDGANVGVVFLGPTHSNLPSGLRQTLTNVLQARTVYTLTVDVGNMNTDPTPPHNQFNFTGFPGYRVELLAGGAVVASDDNSLLPGEGRFLTATVMLATASSSTNFGSALGIRLLNLDAAAGIEVNFDNVRLDAVPRPDPVIRIDPMPGGGVGIDFTEILSRSDDLVTWTPVTPQPASPYVFSPTSGAAYFRATD